MGIISQGQPGRIIGADGRVDQVVGRGEELARLRAAAVRLAGGSGGVVWIDGEPGMGKTALVQASLSDFRSVGARIFRAEGDELTQAVPLRLIADCLGVSRPGTDEFRMEITDLLAGYGGVVNAVLAASERLLSLVDRECAQSPIVLVTDDVQWADEASIAVLRRMSDSAAQMPLLLMAACRPVPLRPEVDRLRHALGQSPDAILLKLGPLTPDQAAMLAGRRLAGQPGPKLVAELSLAAGNPLYLREIVDVLLRDGALNTTDGVTDLTTAPSKLSLGAAIRARLQFLSPPVHFLLQTASLLDDRFDLEELALVSDRSIPQVAEMVHEALVAGVLAEENAKLMFRHSLIRKALQDGLPAALRTGLHGHAANLLAATRSSWQRVARHLLAAPDAVDGWALDWLADVAADALYALPETSVELLHAARAHVTTSDSRCGLFTTRLITVLRLLSRHDDLIRVGTDALAWITEPSLIGEIAWNLSRAYRRLDRQADALALIRRILDGPDPGVPWRSRLRAQMVHSLFLSGDFMQGLTEAQQAMSEGQRDQDPITIGTASLGLNGGLLREDDLALVDSALAGVSGVDAESASLRIALRGVRILSLYSLGRSEWKTELTETLAMGEREGSTQQQNMIVHAAGFFMEQGDFDQSLLYLDQVPDGPNLVGRKRAEAAGYRARIALCRGDYAEARNHLRVLDETQDVLPVYRSGLHVVAALLAEGEGRLETAAIMLMQQLDRAHPWWNLDDYVAELVRLALAAGQAEIAREAVELAEAAAISSIERFVVSAKVCRAMLDDDQRALLDVTAYLKRVGRRPFLAFTLQEAAVRLAEQGDIASARTAFNQALDIFDDMESAFDVRRAKMRFRQYGIRRGPRSSHRRAVAGWPALTEAERTVAVAVAEGRSNPEIAAQMLISRRTVECHIGHILRKLQVRSRVEIAREVLLVHRPVEGDH